MHKTSVSFSLPLLSVPSTSSDQMEDSLNLCANSAVQEFMKCAFCDKYLSIPPIYVQGEQLICGRCQFVNKANDSETEWTRQILYESVAQFFIFPCSNVASGCKSQLKWGEVEEHENTCFYKKLTCPFKHDDVFMTAKCRWTGSGPELNEHLEISHGDQIKKLPEINFTEIESNEIYLTRILKQLMVVVLKFEPPEKMSCLVMVNGTKADCDAFRYQLELYDESKKSSLILRRSRLEDTVAFDENLSNVDKLLTVQLPVVKNLLKNAGNVFGRFGVIKKSKKELSGVERGLSFQQDCSLDENILHELECPICKNYMTPPITICSQGHSFCLDCKEQMDECPTCRRPFHEGRNYTLEKLTAYINYPCMYKEAGCSFACLSDKIKDHERDCNFSAVQQCFLICPSAGAMNMFKHLKEKHEDSLITAGDINILDVAERDYFIKYHAICLGSDIFRLVVSYDGDLKVSLQQFGVQKSNYSYEVEICCTEPWKKVIMGSECLPLSCTEIWDSSVEITEEMIERFISEEDLIFFKVHLKKIA